jgi:hypothetical protein
VLFRRLKRQIHMPLITSHRVNINFELVALSVGSTVYPPTNHLALSVTSRPSRIQHNYGG